MDVRRFRQAFGVEDRGRLRELMRLDREAQWRERDVDRQEMRALVEQHHPREAPDDVVETWMHENPNMGPKTPYERYAMQQRAEMDYHPRTWMERPVREYESRLLQPSEFGAVVSPQHHSSTDETRVSRMVPSKAPPIEIQTFEDEHPGQMVLTDGNHRFTAASIAGQPVRANITRLGAPERRESEDEY